MKVLFLLASLFLFLDVYASSDLVTSPYEACKDQILVKESAYANDRTKWDNMSSTCGSHVLVTPDIGITSLNPLDNGAKYLLFSHKVAEKVLENIKKSQKYAECSALCFSGAPVCIDISTPDKRAVKCSDRKKEVTEAMRVYSRKIKMELALSLNSSEWLNVNVDNAINFAYNHKDKLINDSLRDFDMGTPNPVGRKNLTAPELKEAQRRRDYELKKIEDENQKRGLPKYSFWQAKKIVERFEEHQQRYRELIYEEAPIFGVIEDAKFDDKNNPVWTDEQIAKAFTQLADNAKLTKEKVNWSLKNGKLEFERDTGEAVKKWFSALNSKNTNTNDLLFYIGMKNQVEEVLKEDPSFCNVATAMEARLSSKEMQNTGMLVTASLGASVGGRVAGGAFNVFRLASGLEITNLTGLAMGSAYIGDNFQRYSTKTTEAATRSGLDKEQEGSRLRDEKEIYSSQEQLKLSLLFAPLDGVTAWKSGKKLVNSLSQLGKEEKAVLATKEGQEALTKIAKQIEKDPVLKKSDDRIVALIKDAAEDTSKVLKQRAPSQTQAKIGQFVETLDSFPLAKDMRLSKYRNDAGEEFIMYEKVVTNAKGESVIQKRELPVDKLTNAFDANYPAGREYLEDLIKSKSNKATLAFIDVNNLGYVNSNFVKGREAGDAYLKEVAKAIERATEGKGQLFKLGGDEYGVVINEADPVKAQKILQKIIDESYSPSVHKIFKENTILKAKEVREGKKIDPEGNNLLLYSELKDSFKAYAPYSKEGISLGATTIRAGDNLESLLKTAESQAVKQKIVTKEQMNISAKKYGGADAVPGAIPNLNYKPTAGAPTLSDIKPIFPRPNTATDIKLVKNSATETPGKEKFRFGEVSVVEQSLPDGSSVYNYNKYYTNKDGQRDFVTRELVFNSKTELVDATHESGKFVVTELTKGKGAAKNERGMIWINAENLGKINYFKDPKGIKEGTSIGDSYLKFVAETVKKELGEKGVPIKLSGSEFVGFQDKLNPKLLKDVQARVRKALENHPGIKKIYNDQIQYLENEISKIVTLPQNAENGKKLAELIDNLAATKKMKPEFSIESHLLQESDNYDSALRATRGKRYP